MTRKVLLTGASGRIGTMFRGAVAGQYDLVLVDKNGGKKNEPDGAPVIETDLADLAVCQHLCAGVDTVVHLAADPSPAADFYGSLLDNNIKAVYNIFCAAKDQGCRRVVYASSVQVIEGYPLDVQAKVDAPIKPMNMYAVCKAFGEATAHYFAYAEGLSSIAVRIAAYEGNRPPDQWITDGRTLSAFVSKRDLAHLLVRCIEVEDVQFGIVHAVSDNRFKRMDITETRALVGYEPQDDAFELFKIGIENGPRWDEEYGRGARRAVTA